MDSEALTTATQSATTQFLTTARPIIKAMFAVEDAGCVVGNAARHDPTCYMPYAKRSASVRDWQEVQTTISKTCDALHDMLDGIRDNALCDHYVNVDYDGTEDAIVEQEAFNDELARGVIGVDAAVKMIGDEQ